MLLLSLLSPLPSSRCQVPNPLVTDVVRYQCQGAGYEVVFPLHVSVVCDLVVKERITKNNEDE
jgi:hypothetical protein